MPTGRGFLQISEQVTLVMVVRRRKMMMVIRKMMMVMLNSGSETFVGQLCFWGGWAVPWCRFFSVVVGFFFGGGAIFLGLGQWRVAGCHIWGERPLHRSALGIAVAAKR